jgi:DNA-binding FadR family transcriptional regulator
MLEANITLHTAILLACQNPFFAQLQDLVVALLTHSFHLSPATPLTQQAAQAHTKLRDAVIRRRANAARSAMHKIIANMLELIESASSSRRAPLP